MNRKNKPIVILIVLSMFLASCSFDALSGATSTPESTSTPLATSTNTATPTKTPVPTRTPNLAATQQYEDWQAEIQAFADKGYIPSADGKIEKVKDFDESWAQIGWYSSLPIGEVAENFVYSGHFEWESASKTPDVSGCGFVFAMQNDGSDYSIFIDRGEIFYLHTKPPYGYPVGITRGSKRLDFKESPYEADVTIIVYDLYSYVIINGEVAAEYTLAKSDPVKGDLGFAILSGTNKDYGTRCKVTESYLWRPNN